MTDCHKENLCDWVNEDCDLPTRVLQEKFRDEFGFSPSSSTIDRAVRGFHYTMKRTKPIPERRNCVKTIEDRFIYAANIYRYRNSGRPMFFLDEFGISVSTRPSYGRSPLGQPAYKKVASIRSKNFSVEAIMSTEGIYFFEVMNVAHNVEHFEQFLVRVVNFFIRDGIQNAVVVMDNVQFHKDKNKTAENLLAAHGHTIFYLPPYSPFLNPIENVFSQWKHYVKQSNSKDEQQLRQNIDKAHEKITSDQCKSYIRHMTTYLDRCIRREHIED